MKKTIFIEIILAFTITVLIVCAVKFMAYVIDLNYRLELLKYCAPGEQTALLTTKYTNQRNEALSCGIPLIISTITTFIVMVIIALKDFPVFKPMLDKLSAKRDARKQAKAAKAVADKQARIERLQSELDALKKDE